MNVKNLLATAIAGQVAGDKDTVAAAIKKVVTEKAKRIVNESRGAPDFEFEEVTVVYNGEEYLGNAFINVHTFRPATSGNYSPRAADPSEYYGDEEELEFDIVELQLYDENGDPLPPILGKEAEALVSDSERERIGSWLSDQIHAKRDDEPDYDEYRYERRMGRYDY